MLKRVYKKYPKIYVRQSKIHYRGVFASTLIKKGERIVEYTGRKITNAQASMSNSDYLFDINDRYFIDGKNVARYINHACNPNCESDVINGKIWIMASRDIEKGEELAYSYRFNLEECLDYPCNCGYRKCPGYILDEESWPKLGRYLDQLKKKKLSKKRKQRV